ncbi:cytochrome c biogenesis protein CcmG/thiol:disulfide interchange protein DsbE [Sphingomonas kyeonggiensis]|uniref:Cytochrome c biogenesis protein CcmG/thiol:disulfide interchange protein DsbE n=1 Tax=Sphingomonas kyeonggiensis TaxID=1268553 RepID=A0A7W7NT46_9SPHN|nr:DsbE family thiol:disulfide interchange protein [Sphingomonas kyeonggiensis]MBB4839491.1 cytochrome c biogenesis protein CcmG/thiol:disulfide interchange protein DsbE [Sphingomonas kyeonggiensis]
MRRLLIWAPLALFALVFALVASGLLKPGDRTIHSAMVGKPVPELAMKPLLADRPGVASAELHGKPRLLNVFASWCIPCIAEAPQLLKLKQAGVEIDAIAIRDTPEAVQAFLARNGDPYARIGDDPTGKAQIALGSSGVPETFLIDAQGRIIDQHIGDIRADDIPAILAKLEAAK